MKQHASRIVGKSKWPLLAIFGLLACVLVFAACGGGGGSTSAETEATTTEEEGGGAEEETVSGEPIVTWTYTDVNTEGPQYKNIEETARVYQEWINTHGGIAGRPLEANFCDAKGTPTGVAACGREAVAGGAVALVGNFTFTGDAIVPILEKADTAQWGNCCAIAPSELTSPISFPMGNQPLYSVGLVQKAVEDGCKHINGVHHRRRRSLHPADGKRGEIARTRRSRSSSPCRQPRRTTARRLRKPRPAAPTAW